MRTEKEKGKGVLKGHLLLGSGLRFETLDLAIQRKLRLGNDLDRELLSISSKGKSVNLACKFAGTESAHSLLRLSNGLGQVDLGSIVIKLSMVLHCETLRG